MKSESADVANRYATAKSGFHLLVCEEAVLPIFVITASVLLQQRKTISPVSEFVLRCLSEGISSPDEIESFLGVELSSVVRTLTQLWQSDLVEMVATNNAQTFRLTREGLKTLGELIEVTPIERDVWFAFDQQTWKPVPISTTRLLAPKNVDENNYIKIKPAKPSMPTTLDLSARSVDAAIKTSMGLEMADVDVLVIKSIERVEKKYLFCHLLIYESENMREHAVEVVIDGRINREAGAMIDNLGGVSFLGLKFEIPAKNIKSEVKNLEIVINNLAKPVLSLEEVTAIRMRHFVEAVEPTSQTEQIELISVNKSVCDPIENLEVRHIDTYEHRAYLDRAISDSKHRLLITCPWVRSNVVRNDLSNALYAAAKRGVFIHIGYGITEDADDCDSTAIKVLEQLASQYKNVVVSCLGSTHAKILIWDDNFVVGSFNWLSFRGDHDRTYRQEHSILVMNQVNESYKMWEEQKAWIERRAGKVAAR